MTRLPSTRANKLDAVPLLGRGEPPLDPLEQPVLLVVLLAELALRRQLDRRVDEEGAEDVEDPAEVLDRGGAKSDEDPAHDQRQDDAHEQGCLLVHPRHLELRHDDDEDEQVVDGEAVLRQPAGVELARVLRAGEERAPRSRRRWPARRRTRWRSRTRASSGSCGRRPMMNTSTASRPTSRAMLASHNQVGTFTRGYLRRRWIAPEVSSARPAVAGGPAAPGRTQSGRDDDAAAKEYSPPLPLSLASRPGCRHIGCPTAGSRAANHTACAGRLSATLTARRGRTARRRASAAPGRP